MISSHYVALFQKSTEGVAAALAAGDEEALDDNLCELVLVAESNAPAIYRSRAARLLKDHRYWERFAEREVARIQDASAGIPAALAKADAAKVQDYLADLAMIAEASEVAANRAAAQREIDLYNGDVRRVINRHFKAFDKTAQPRA